MPKVSISGPPKTIIMPMREHPRSEVERSRIHEVSMARVSPKDIFLKMMGLSQRVTLSFLHHPVYDL